MELSRQLVLAIGIALLCCGGANSYSITSPQEKVGGGILGQEEIGPIENYTCPDSGIFAHEDCEYFITCWSNQPVLHRCTAVMLFDLRYNGCDYAENVDCGDRRRPPDFPGTRTPPTSSTTFNPSISTTPPPNGTFDCPDNGVFPHVERCEYYWNCWDGVAALHHCELDYLFDLEYDGCNHPELVDCGSRERPIDSSSTISTTTARGTTTSGVTRTTRNPGGEFQCPEPEGLFTDPADCGAFYSCLESIPIHEVCPPGLHFNPITTACDWPDAAGCSLSDAQ